MLVIPHPPVLAAGETTARRVIAVFRYFISKDFHIPRRTLANFPCMIKLLRIFLRQPC